MEKTTSAAKTSIYRAIVLLTRVLGCGAVFFIMLFLFPLAIPYIKHATSYKYLTTALAIDKVVYFFVQANMPTTVAGKNVTRVIMVGVVFILRMVISRIQLHFEDKLASLKVKSEYEEWKNRMHLADDAQVLTPLKGKLDKFGTSNKKERGELLQLFAETKRKLDAMGRDLAFLAIDIVDSTGMKQDEERALAEHDFMEYKRFVDSKLTSNGSLKSAWTPDGVMSCFPNVDAAVKAAREVITGLDTFNKNVKTIRQNFKVRCGINHGYVYFDESVPLEEISDRVIDIAGHMQKHAQPNTICVAKIVVEPLEKRHGFVPAGRAVDGYEVYMWEKG
jgi:class 3 adenylate cyclase